MPPTLSARLGTLVALLECRPGLELWRVALAEAQTEAQAVLYPALTGPGQPGRPVWLNTTAVELGLGTGGQHLVMGAASSEAPASPPVRREEGHIMKLRYTPCQVRVCAAEEEASPEHAILATADALPGTPVVCLGLHSQLAPAAAAIKAVNPALRVGYLMTDSAALPLAYSRLVAQLRAAGLLDCTITVGQAFGGELEAVNLYSGLVVAAHAGRVDVIIAGQGPGNAGTGTALGFGGIDQALCVNAAAVLDGQPVVVPRLSQADPRPRHQGVSHHTRTVLTRLVLAPALVALPHLAPAFHAQVTAQLAPGRQPHHLVIADGEPGIALCQARGIALSSMGRPLDADPVFFLAAAAAGRVAAERVAGGNGDPGP
jgi:hypothetical protein